MKWSFWHSFSLLLTVGLIVLIGFVMPSHSYFWTLVIIGLILIISIMVIGHGITGIWKGVLINEENKVSLSRFQLACWTVVVLSAFLAAAFINIVRRAPDPLAIAIPENLWILLGISTTSLVGSPLIKSTKKTKPFKLKDFLNTLTFKTLEKKGYGAEKISNVGYMVVNINSKDSSWGDMFKGEEVGNAAQLDLSKIQMFYFTIIVVVSYIVAVCVQFAGATNRITELPGLTAGMVALLGISHGGFLVNKAVPRPVA